MNANQIKIVKKTWRVLMMIDPKVIGDVFYSKLFSDYPQIRKMFPTDMDKQYVKLVEMLTSIVSRLDRLEDISDDIVAMAKRHTGYNVKASHYDMVGTSLLWTLKTALKDDWTKEVEDAWATCYNTLANTMLVNS